MTTQPNNLATDGQPDSRPVELSVTYRQSDGELRAAVIAVDGDIDGATGVVVDHLAGAEERLGAALGVLLTYVDDQVAFHNGDRERHSPESPLPREPQEVGIARVRRDAERALKAAEADRQRGSDPKNAEWLQRVTDLAEQQRAAIHAGRQAEQQPERQPLAA
jgi:hypothetical protein